MPGMLPASAFSLKQMRHMPNGLIYPRRRPQIMQRLYARVENFAGLFCLAIQDFLANLLLLLHGVQSHV